MRGLVKNQQLWSLLLRDMGSSSNGLPQVLKSDLMSLGFLTLRETIMAMGDGSRSVAGLIQVNEDMIEGLRSLPSIRAAEVHGKELMSVS